MKLSTYIWRYGMLSVILGMITGAICGITQDRMGIEELKLTGIAIAFFIVLFIAIRFSK